ncbi:MAG: EAL domain-containing protein [Cyanothece sp. SIO2G6]|nr:EAL domain-containing protein [Cyanothece sp. SIO2G6]
MIFTIFRNLSQTIQVAKRSQHSHPLWLRCPLMLASFSVTGILLIVRQMGGLQTWELAVYDQLTRWQAPATATSRIVVVEITEADLRTQNSPILSDRVMAQTLATLQQHQPQVIGLDLFRDIPQEPGHDELVQALTAPNVVVINELADLDQQMVPAPPSVPPDRVGFNDFVLDSDNVVRRHWMYGFWGDRQFYAFSLQLALNYLADQNMELTILPDSLQIGDTSFPRLQPSSGGYQTLESAGHQTLVRYAPHDLFYRVTAAEITSGTVTPADLSDKVVVMTLTDILSVELPSVWIRDKVVLIGSTGASSKDFFVTPYTGHLNQSNNGQRLAGVLLHALLTRQILTTVLDQSALISFWSEWVEIVWIGLWSLVGGAIAWRFKHPAKLGVVVAIALSSLFGICWLSFSTAVWIPFVAPALALAITTGCIMAYSVFQATYYDLLTGLPNRTLFLQHVQKSLAKLPQQPTSTFLAILCLDINRFKVISEGYGHYVGDQLLMQTANRIQTCVPADCTLARVGGSEFALLLPHLKDQDGVDTIVNDIQSSLGQPILLNEQDLFITTSIGITIGSIEDSKLQADILLRDAHTAMYQAKALGKPRQFFANGMHNRAASRLQLESELRHGIEQQEFLLHYQPIISLTTGKITGFEALVRWQHPQQGVVFPGTFISVAEETGLIIPMGRWILAEACRQMQQWHQQFPQHPQLMIGVNLSSRQFTHNHLIEEIGQILEETQLDCHSLKLEITESMAMSDVEAAIEMLFRLKQMNLTLSIDDFGTGYSSLSYLHRFPTDILKVDRSFVSRMESGDEDNEIVKTIITLGHNLGMAVVAEGVENELQLAMLRELGCEYGQGYFFAKPMSAAKTTELLERSPQW